MALQIATAGTGVARDAHYVAPSGTAIPVRTLLLEPQATNLFQRSEEISDAYWTKSASTVTSDATAAPDGATTADKLVETATAAVHFFQRAVSFTSGTTYTMSFFVKAAERTTCALQLPSGPFSANGLAIFDLSAGTVTSVTAGFTARIVAFSNGWYRCIITATATVTAAGNVSIRIQSGSYTGDGTSGIFVWGAQMETGPVATSYIKTVGSTVTRNADSLYWGLASLDPCREMTVYTRGVAMHGFTADGNRVFHVGDTLATGARFFCETRSAGNYRLTHNNGVTGVNSDGPTGPVPRDMVEIRGVLAANGAVTLGQTLNGGSESVGTTSAGNALTTAWAAQRFYLNSASDGGQLGMAYTHAAIALGQKTRGEMRAIAGVV